MYNRFTPKQQEWRRVWPSGFIALIATVQLLLTLAIIGTETTSLIIDFFHSMIFAGFFCSLFFMITWISMFTVTCCNRHSLGCATHVLIENILSIIAASVLLYFDNLFLNNPFTCLYGSTSDCSPSYNSYSNTIYYSTNYTIKLACIKAQLACTAVMLVSNVIYTIIFIVVAIKTRNESTQAIELANLNSGPPQHIIYPSHLPAASQQQIFTQGQPFVSYGKCPKCNTLVPASTGSAQPIHREQQNQIPATSGNQAVIIPASNILEYRTERF